MKKYIRRNFGKGFKVKFQRHFYNRAIAAVEDNILLLTQKLRIHFKNYESVIWHEIGHIKTSEGKGPSIKSERNAQVWALRETKRRNRFELYNDLLEMVTHWAYMTKDDGADYLLYKRAAKQILKMPEFRK